MGVVSEVANVVVPAAAGLAGAWWGGRITQRSAREAAAENERRRREDEVVATRAAARLLREQLRKVTRSIDVALEKRYWREAEMDFAVWDAQSPILARFLDEDEWATVSRGVDIARLHAELTPDFRGPQKGDQSVRAVLEGYLQDLRPAMDVLHRYITIGLLLRG